MQTICAIATAEGEGALAVVRISGEKAIEVAEKVFTPYNKKISNMAGYTCAYGFLHDKETQIDDAVLTLFKAPHSYTGEDCAEISCHGGKYVTEKIYRLCCENGAVPAQRGEFTKQAFLNGKIDLTRAESVMDLISAQGELTLRSANLTRQGVLFRKIQSIKDHLVELLGNLAAWVDYPEEDLPEVGEKSMIDTLTTCLDEISKLISNYDNGMILKSGVPAVIVGKPNVGKSTLMNLLLGYDRAIVTDIAGTTRDLLEESVRVGDVTLRLADTAGIRDTQDTVEKIGVELANKRLGESSLVLVVFDGSTPPDDEDTALIKKVKTLDGKVIALINKSDIHTDSGYYSICEGLPFVIEISARDGVGKEKIELAVAELFGASGDSSDSLLFVNMRQRDCLIKAKESLLKAVDAISQGFTPDICGIPIEEAVGAICELTGESVNEQIVNEVFSKFCVGK